MDKVVMVNSCVSISRTDRRVSRDDFRIPFLVSKMLYIQVSLLAMHSYNFGLEFGNCRTSFLLGDNLGAFTCKIQYFFPRRSQSRKQIFPSQEDFDWVDLLKIELLVGGKEYISSILFGRWRFDKSSYSFKLWLESLAIWYFLTQRACFTKRRGPLSIMLAT